MQFFRIFIPKILLVLIINQFFFQTKAVNSAENIKIIYGVFSRTIEIDALKNFAETGYSTDKLRRVLNATGSSDAEIKNILNKNYEIPITIASKLINSKIGNIVLRKLSSVIHPQNAIDEKTGILALRSSVIQGIYSGNGKINIINFFESYPTKTVILNVNTFSKIMNKVESISDLLDFFTSSPLEKIKTN